MREGAYSFSLIPFLLFPNRAVTHSFDVLSEEEDSIEGMKKLIIEEVKQFRAEVRAQARAAGQIQRSGR